MTKKKRYYIKPLQSTGRRAPTYWLITVWLLFDRLQAPEWLMGIYWFITACFFLLFTYDFFAVDEEMVDVQRLLKDEITRQEHEKDIQEKKEKSKWEQRINELREQKSKTT